MKKVFVIIVCFLFTFTLISCKPKEKAQAKKEEGQKFDINIATNILDSYMEYIHAGDFERGKTLLSEKMLKEGISLYNTDLKIVGYKTDEVNEVGRSAVFRVKVAKLVPEKTITILDNYSIKVELEKKDYKITEINAETEKEAFWEGTGLRLKDKNNVKTNLIVDSSGIPYYVYPKDDSAKINKTPVPRINFGITVFNYSGERIAITTHNDNSYIGIVKIDETQSSQGGGGGGGGSAGGGGGGGDQGGGSNTMIKEPPIGKDITSLDLIKDSTIDLICFSMEDKHLVTQYKVKDKGSTLRVYDVDSGELAEFDFQKEFPMGKVDLTFSSFGKDALNFEAKEKSTTGKDGAKLLGKWQLDLKEYKVKKL